MLCAWFPYLRSLFPYLVKPVFVIVSFYLVYVRYPVESTPKPSLSFQAELQSMFKRLRKTRTDNLEPIPMADFGNNGNNENNRNNPNRPQPPPLKDYFIPTAYTPQACIELPEVTASHFEIKSSTITLLASFRGRIKEDPYHHSREFQDMLYIKNPKSN